MSLDVLKSEKNRSGLTNKIHKLYVLMLTIGNIWEVQQLMNEIYMILHPMIKSQTKCSHKLAWILIELRDLL